MIDSLVSKNALASKFSYYTYNNSPLKYLFRVSGFSKSMGLIKTNANYAAD